MKKFLALMQREWLQHRFGWMLMMLIPLGLALLLVGFGHIQGLSDGWHGEDIVINDVQTPVRDLPMMLAMIAISASMGVMFLVAWIGSLIIVSGLARRDHADRSIEFWLSLPTSHRDSLAAPLLVHLLLVPAAALFIGLVGGGLLSLVLVGRVAGVGAWFALPWWQIVPGTLALLARLLAGLPLATLWLAPLILLVVLMTAWFRRWGWVILGVGLGLGSQLLKRLFGQPLLSQLTTDLLSNAATSMVHAVSGAPSFGPEKDTGAVLGSLPAWALHDLGLALRDLASPLLAGGLLFAAGCFALLMLWRQRGAGATA
jgi:hypothetical protein